MLGFIDLIQQRRSWKPAAMDADREVPRHLIETLLTAAQAAPTHGLTQPWRFRIFTGASRAALAESLPLVYDQVTPADEVRPEKRAKLKLVPLQVPVVISIGVATLPGGKISEREEICAVACAVQNMHLAATALGLAAMWSSPPLCSTPVGSAALGHGPHELSLGFFYVGWPRPGASAPAMPPREPMTPPRVVWNG
jgi:nitroreductase